jgi:hypothetical protein
LKLSPGIWSRFGDYFTIRFEDSERRIMQGKRNFSNGNERPVRSRSSLETVFISGQEQSVSRSPRPPEPSAGQDPSETLAIGTVCAWKSRIWRLPGYRTVRRSALAFLNVHYVLEIGRARLCTFGPHKRYALDISDRTSNRHSGLGLSSSHAAIISEDILNMNSRWYQSGTPKQARQCRKPHSSDSSVLPLLIIISCDHGPAHR